MSCLWSCLCCSNKHKWKLKAARWSSVAQQSCTGKARHLSISKTILITVYDIRVANNIVSALLLLQLDSVTLKGLPNFMAALRSCWMDCSLPYKELLGKLCQKLATINLDYWVKNNIYLENSGSNPAGLTGPTMNKLKQCIFVWVINHITVITVVN